MLGAYQKENINTTVTAINELQKQNWKITEENIKSGLLKIVKNTQVKIVLFVPKKLCWKLPIHKNILKNSIIKYLLRNLDNPKT